MERRNGEQGPRASFQFRLNPERIGWIHAALSSQPEVTLYDGDFPEPFSRLSYLAALRGNELTLRVILEPDESFNQKYGQTVGTEEDLSPLLTRYQKYNFSEGKDSVQVFKEDQLAGTIYRSQDGKIVIQKGGQAGQLPISPDSPVNNLSIYLDQFNLLAQRYISAIWKAIPESDQKQMQLVLSLPQIPEGALTAYFSTDEIITKEFASHPRPVMLDDIGGFSRIKETIMGLLMDLTDPETSRRFGTQPFSNKFILITGDEGTGKSLFPKAIDALMRKALGENVEHFRLPFEDIIAKYGPHADTVVTTVLNHVRENERKQIPTLLHLDNLESLVHPIDRATIRSRGDSAGNLTVSTAEFSYYLQVVNPIIVVLRDFGQELGARSQHVIVFGESRLKREDHPEAVSRTFRRAFHLDPTVDDLAETLIAQVRTTRSFAASTAVDPFELDIDMEIETIAASAQGLVGRDIQQAFLNISSRHKANWDGSTPSPITAEELKNELNQIKLDKGIQSQTERQIGFRPRSRLQS